eukprot:CAMPEP_0114656242 /NCGR_PEP_ID=MMETSP0191-20121206/12010_1 /TAXON_ID=126664 /ORGANISM="Sorites sp." /LENGTH=140 /DNA_ID=CAMNT_0001872985 /DNA_START=1200 /DNA_END=1625 /DNA_ORIENTATION=+
MDMDMNKSALQNQTVLSQTQMKLCDTQVPDDYKFNIQIRQNSQCISGKASTQHSQQSNHNQMPPPNNTNHMQIIQENNDNNNNDINNDTNNNDNNNEDNNKENTNNINDDDGWNFDFGDDDEWGNNSQQNISNSNRKQFF